MPFARIPERADAQRLAQAAQEQLAMEQQTPTGMGADADHPFTGGPMPPGAAPQGMPPGMPPGAPPAKPGGTARPFGLERQPPANSQVGPVLGTQ